jgi:hypothetical protein
MTSPCLINTSQPRQKHRDIFTFSGILDRPRAQKSAPGGKSASWFSFHVGHIVQMHCSRFSSVSSTLWASSFGVFMILSQSGNITGKHNILPRIVPGIHAGDGAEYTSCLAREYGFFTTDF